MELNNRIQTIRNEKAQKEAGKQKVEDLKQTQSDLSEIFEKRNSNVKTIEERLK